MKAVIELAGQQHLIAEGDSFKIRKNIETGTKVKIEKALLLIDNDKIEIGKPEIIVDIELEVTETKKDKKIRVLKYKPKKGYRKVNNHRQDISILKVNKINK